MPTSRPLPPESPMTRKIYRNACLRFLAILALGCGAAFVLTYFTGFQSAMTLPLAAALAAFEGGWSIARRHLELRRGGLWRLAGGYAASLVGLIAVVLVGMRATATAAGDISILAVSLAALVILWPMVGACLWSGIRLRRLAIAD